MNNKFLLNKITILVLLFLSFGAWSAQNNQSGGFGTTSFSCDSTVGKCNCSSTGDCFDMEKHCEDPEKVTCKKNTSNCSCKWKAKSSGDFKEPNRNKTKNNFLLKK